MSKQTLSKENAARIFTSWKSQIRNYLRSIPLPKKFLGTQTGIIDTSSTSAKHTFHEIQGLHDFINKPIPPPEKEAYATLNQYREDLQKFNQCVATVKVAMRDFLSEHLYEIFDAEEHCHEGMKAVLLELKYDESSRLKILQRQVELIAQLDSQTVKEYADSVNHLVLQLQGLGVKTSAVDFQRNLSERFVLGMVPEHSRRLRAIFRHQDIETFNDMKAYIHEESANEDLS